MKLFPMTLCPALLFAIALTVPQLGVADTPSKAKLSAEDTAKRIQAFYQQTSDFQSHFVQTYTDIAAGDEKVSQGRVYFKKPGKMRWDYVSAKDSKKRDKVYVSDGRAFWVYEYEFKQVFKQCLKDSQLPTSLRFLLGQGDLLAEFDVSLLEKSTAENPELKLIPKEATSKFKALQFTVDSKTGQVIRTLLFDPYGNTNEIVFSKTRVNRNLPDKGFAFKPPKDARMINPSKACD
jgi:outer membrane lipoprotein carrier protein